MATYGMAEAFGCLAMADGNTGSHITPVSRVLRLVISNTLGRYTYDFDLQGSCGRRQQHATFKASGYISENPDVMKNAFDSEGFYRTGGIGKLENDIIYILGRASQDVIRFECWEIYAPEVEVELSLVPHPPNHRPRRVIPKIHRRVAVLLTLKDQSTISQKLDIGSLHQWLFNDRKLNKYRRPTVVRILWPGEVVPVTAWNKPVKGKIREAGVLRFGILVLRKGSEERPFHWARIQAD
ncbi:uncharacterized protein ACHE_50987A [Aspergillus chevalieri]|uniref:AMP-dependent synthetase/ligase domain-containing protein n=1 Tax=Aspergillus chevalieri TaxID=182096 RepID=A0A7R7VS51_ASPCH|nr:uncharacterized protein ACHE_50987A [Aspergillus chevalieri]BCR89789.1 hypothetical protein ACHE_50987A [Aspergillus chevalieri]